MRSLKHLKVFLCASIFLLSFSFSYNSSRISETSAEDASFIPYRSGDLWGYSDANGKIIIVPQYSTAGFFYKGRAIVRKDYLYYLIDENNKYITKQGFQQMDIRIDCKLNQACYPVKSGKEYYMIDRNGKRREGPCYCPNNSREYINEHEESLIADTLVNNKDRQYFRADPAKKIYKLIGNAGDTLFDYFYIVLSDSLYGIVYHNGTELRQVIPCAYSDIDYLNLTCAP